MKDLRGKLSRFIAFLHNVGIIVVVLLKRTRTVIGYQKLAGKLLWFKVYSFKTFMIFGMPIDHHIIMAVA